MSELKYWAFLSYSHQDNLETRKDGTRGCIRWAEWLHGSLETYRVPAEFRTRQTRTAEAMPERFFPVFQDEKELPINADLGESIRTALRQSRFLIVICSPRSATSRYVNEEVRYFKELGRQDRIMTLMIDGEPNVSFGNKAGFGANEECFCPALRHPLDAQHQVDVTRTDAQEPIAGDVRIKDAASTREATRSDLHAHRPVLDYMKLKLLAGLMGAGFDELAQRDKERQLREERAKARRLRKLVAAFAVLALIAAVAGAIAFFKEREAARARDEARATLSQSDFLQALSSINDEKNYEALAQLARSLSFNRDNQGATCRLATLLTYHTYTTLLLSLKHNGSVVSAQFSPDGQRIVTASYDMTARVWDAQTGKPVTEPMKHDGIIVSAQFSPDGQRIVTASNDKTARVWDAQTGKPVTESIKHDGIVASAQFSADSKRIVTASFYSAQVWDAETGKPMIESMKPGGFVESARFSPDGKRIVTASTDNTARVWDAQTGKPLTEPMKHGGAEHGYVLKTAQFSPDGKRIVTASTDKTARVWDAQTGKPLTEPMKHDGSVESAQFSPDGGRIVTASTDKTARAWDAQTGKPLAEPMKHEGFVRSAQFSVDGKRIVTASDTTARMWDAQTGKPVSEPMKHDDYVVSAQFSPDGKQIVTAAGMAVGAYFDRPGYARVWNAQMGKPLSEPMKHDGGVASAQFSADGKRIVTLSAHTTVRVWDAQTGKPLSEPMKDDDFINSAQFSPDGKWIVTTAGIVDTAEIVTGVDQPGYARVWDAQTGKPVAEPMKHNGGVASAQFSPDGKRIVTASYDKTARVWDAQTGKPLSEPMKHEGFVGSAQFSPDGRRIVTASYDKTARVWNAQTGKLLTEPMTHDYVVESAQFSADGKHIVTIATQAGFDQPGYARVWDAQTGKPLSEPIKHDGPVSSAQFSPDGKRIVTASEWTARVWDAQSGKPLAEPMKHDNFIASAQFSADGKRIVTASYDETARVWDAETGKPLTEPMKHDGWVHSAQFSSDGRRIVSASEDNTARLWDISPTDKPSSKWLPELADAVARQHLNDKGVFEPLNQDSAEVLKKIKEQLNRESAENDWVIWGRWFLADRSIRTISPFSKVTVPEYIENRIKENTPASLDEAEQLAVGSPQLQQQIQKAREALKGETNH